MTRYAGVRPRPLRFTILTKSSFKDSGENSEKRRFWDFGEKYTFDRKTSATKVFISSMVMIFILGFAKNINFSLIMNSFSPRAKKSVPVVHPPQSVSQKCDLYPG